ncbi:nucleotidyltransferase [Candidatus Shapirobacteria bacterium CG_4_8_14_3_um_filter_35_11]|uniref:Nucleotidyltransferase n=1 Tax=Candidatus Shapirobacteria bacterium CG_4_8_14_3_um_filter_35_11 TaxID=1974874 RepID=A0A2M8GIQ0_9BACT|nr:MAG: nucleotidyltransferase [Candidatus Shapirobacteria bacterium CG_4_8_14_3_um_filter_35_11]
MDKQSEQLKQFGQAVSRLEEVLQISPTSIIKDSAIQRFEFCMDLTWKILKTILEQEHGIIVKSPKETFKMAYQNKLINYDQKWIDFVDLRNNTVHTYNEELANQTFSQLPGFLILVKKLINSLNKQK